ncbi:Fic family protein [Bacteroides uniformis]|uniref:protein adenylyltransferase n=1 Tax=Bacteroides uniformis TaxID=820 RepID=A0A174K3H9_BACUN|nr:Fic family protein [Bacteroides uniformis]CUP04986.1 Fic family protein [Bacteroides uniformis]
MDDVVAHIAKFVSGIWQIHPFGEGNTRTTAVFTIKYLRSIGFDVNNDLFADKSWFFRNALVRANYRNVRKGVEPDMSFLILFFRNLLMGENHKLKNRYMIINAPQQSTEQADRTSTEQVPNKLTEQLTAPLLSIVKAIGIEQCSLKIIMERIELKHRPTFIANYLTPAIQNGFVAPLYPNNPKHPRQKYLLTVKGLAILNSTK